MSAEVWVGDEPGLAAAAAAVRRLQVIAFPTDTVFGLGCDPGSVEAVARVYELKGRPASMPLILMGADREGLRRYARLSPLAESLGDRFWPGPLTLILEALPAAAALGGQGTVGVRIPDHSLTLALLRRTGPLATTSANPHGLPPVADAEEAVARLPGLAGAVWAPGPVTGPARPSSILDLTRDPPVLVREGTLGAAQLGIPLGSRQTGTRRD